MARALQYKTRVNWLTPYSSHKNKWRLRQMREYEKYEFCKDSKCENFNNGKCDHAGKKPYICNRSAKELHKWLSKNDFVITKRVPSEESAVEDSQAKPCPVSNM